MERLNKFLAHAGVGSRRHCDSLIAGGRVKINGRVVNDLGIRVDPVLQKVSVDDQPVKSEKPVYWVVHKPQGYLCTNRDPSGRPLAIDLIPHVEQRVFTVGRLDESSEGMLLMTNDGELANSLMHPRYEVEKTYQVLVAGKPSPDDLQKLLDGVWLSDGKVKAHEVRRIKSQGDSTWLRVVLNEGKNREIRRMLAKLDHKVLRLKRVAIGPVLLDKLPKGKARKMTLAELGELQKAVAASQKRIERRLTEASEEPNGEMSLEGPRPRLRPPSRPEVRPPLRPDARPEGRPPGRAEGRPEGRAQGRPEGRPQARPEGRDGDRPRGGPNLGPKPPGASRGAPGAGPKPPGGFRGGPGVGPKKPPGGPAQDGPRPGAGGPSRGASGFGGSGGGARPGRRPGPGGPPRPR